MTGESGTVVANFGRQVLVENARGELIPCIISGRKLRPVTGDRVRWEPLDDHGKGLVCSIADRDNELTRPDRRGRTDVLASNITQVVVVCAPRPAPDLFLIDRYLAAAAFMGASAAVVLNKADLDSGSDLDRLRKDLEEYRRIGYPVLHTSAKQMDGLVPLREQLVGHVSILVGQSGVGKSSILNALLPQADILTGELSEASGEGKHTTTASRLYHLESGGDLIDSPGVRDYAPAAFGEADLTQGFVEFAEPARRCRFANCRHLREPQCGVIQAVDDGEICARRYESFKRLERLMDQLRPGY
jgi:ribosome biogenesis GTPase